MDRRSVGHLAFTGCSVWLDFARQTFVVMLSNRVHPTVREDARFRALRQRAISQSRAVESGPPEAAIRRMGKSAK